jgi:endonuclease/exonuclease/phosphatase family metal-dependent hydrolase
MRIATHNVEFLFGEGEHEHSGQTWNYTKEYVTARIEHLGKLYSEIDADILFLQEVASAEVIARIIERTGKSYYSYLATPDVNGVGNAVLYKQKDAVCESIPARTESLPVFIEGDEDTIAERIWSRRDFVGIETLYEGKPLHLFGLHIKANFLVGQKDAADETLPMTTQITSADGLIRSELFRFSQARKMRQVIDELFAGNHDAAILIAGDFNADERNTVYRIISGVIKDAPDSLTSASVTMPKEKRFTVGKNGNKALIDHILLSKNLEQRMTSVRILNENLPDIVGCKNVPPAPSCVESDHFPIVVELG